MGYRLNRQSIRMLHPRLSMRLLSIFLATGILHSFQKPQIPVYLHAPSVDTYAKHDPDGITILSNGRYIKPVGKSIPMAKWPHGMVLSRDCKTLFVASEGVGQIVTDWETDKPFVREIIPTGGKAKKKNNS